MDQPIYFCMSLIGRSAAKNWNNVCQLLDQTLHSILVQTGNIKVFVVCNEIPESRFSSDPRLRFIPIETATPITIQDRRTDRRLKLRRFVEEVCNEGPGYLVTMDADDLISNRLVSYINSTDNRVGYVFYYGYRWNIAGNQFLLTKDFPSHCGTSAAFYLGKDDLTPGKGICKIIETGSHMKYEELCEKFGRPLQRVPFPAAIYIRHHGENISRLQHSVFRMTALRNFMSRLVLRKRVSAEVRKEFSVPSHY